MVTAPSFYNLKDQGIYSAGDFFIPQERYRAAPFTGNTPTNPDEVPAGIPATYQAQNMRGDDNFGPFNPDMGQIRTDFRPEYDFRQFQDFGNLTTDQLTTAQNKEMDNYSDYYRGPPESGLSKMIGSAVNFIPGIGTVSRIAGFLSDKLPINQRAILENQLRGQGVLTDNIGRIVAQQGQYNTPEGIMAGYNAAMMNEGTFDKRLDRISKTLGDKATGGKYGISASDIQGIIDGTVTEEDIQNKYGISTNLISNLKNINIAKQNFVKTQNKAAAIAKFKEEQRRQKAIEKAAAKSRAESARQYDPNVHGPTNYGLGSDGKQSFDTGQGFGTNATTGGPVSNRTGRGRTDYMDGGLADMLEIYD